MTIDLFNEVSNECSRAVTIKYSTSFASAIKMLHPDLRKPVFNIYGFVRFADEIVDTFHNHKKSVLLAQFKNDTFSAIENGISLNPILNSFRETVSTYSIDHNLIEDFFKSMESDLSFNCYDRQGYEEYIYGSAEAVGLMCLYVFCEGNKALFDKLRNAAKALGAAFQKVNFLRDLKSDFMDLSRMYFPECNFHHFTVPDKMKIEAEIEADFKTAFEGILQLPVKARFGVYVAYKYYYSLLKKIKSADPHQILQKRIRIHDYHKAYIILRATVKNRLNLV